MRVKAFLLCLLLSGCAQPPTQEIDMATARVARAQEEGASQYAADILREAETSLARARGALSDSGRYREAVRLAARACLQADEAREKAVGEQERIARQTERYVRECEAILEEARYRGAETRCLTELESFAARFIAVESAFAEGRVSEAHGTAYELKNELLHWLRELEWGQSPPK